MDVVDVLFKIDRAMQQKGHGKMDAATLKETYQRLQHPNVMNALSSGQLTPESIAEQADQGIQQARKRRTSPQQLLQPAQGPMPSTGQLGM